jgi:hypothetical protein
MLVPTRPWDSILGFYGDLEACNACFAPMRRLVAHVAAQPYAGLLFGTTSMHALLVAQHERIEWGHDVLRVEVEPDARMVRFTYQEQQYVRPATWECAGEKIVETFEGFLRRAHWVAR